MDEKNEEQARELQSVNGEQSERMLGSVSTQAAPLNESIISLNQDQEKDPEPPAFVQQSYMYYFCYGKEGFEKRTRDGFMAMFQRKPSALMILDGLRAIAIIWVFATHTVKNWWVANNGPLSYFRYCLQPNLRFPFEFAINGDLGVDIFFVLSGFLIAFILLKERKKYNGEIDIYNFYRGRFLRIWPVITLYTLYNIVAGLFGTGLYGKVPDWWAIVSNCFFVNNFVGPRQHTWSVAVEFQFYMVSPFLVHYMASSKTPWRMPIILCLVSTFLNFFIAYKINPDTVWDVEALNGAADDKYWFWIYEQVWTRATPYGFGMYAAYKHLQDTDHSFISRQPIWLEWIAFIALIVIAFFGGEAQEGLSMNFGGFGHYIYFNTVRQIYGLCLAYLTCIMLSPKPSDSISYQRPTRFLRWMLSWSFWLPIANISYSFYIWHLNFMQSDLYKPFAFIFPPNQNDCPMGLGTAFFSYLGYFLIVFLMTAIVASLCFACIEKPGIDARFVYKNKFDLKKMETARLAWLERNGKAAKTEIKK